MANAVKSATVINMDDCQQQQESNAKMSSTTRKIIIAYILTCLAILLVITSIVLHLSSWNLDFSTMQNTCLHPSSGNWNYQTPKMTRAFTTGPVVICMIFGIYCILKTIFPYKIPPTSTTQIPQWMKEILATLLILGLISLGFAVIGAICSLLTKGLPVFRPDLEELRCGQPIVNYLANYKTHFILPPFTLLAALVVSICAVFIYPDDSQQAIKKETSNISKTGDSPV